MTSDTVENNKTGNMYLESKYGQFWCERSYIAFLLNREIYSFEGKSIHTNNNNKVGNIFFIKNTVQTAKLWNIITI